MLRGGIAAADSVVGSLDKHTPFGTEHAEAIAQTFYSALYYTVNSRFLNQEHQIDSVMCCVLSCPMG